MNHLRTLGGSNRSRCGAAIMLRTQGEPSAHFGRVESPSLWRGAQFERAKRTRARWGRSSRSRCDAAPAFSDKRRGERRDTLRFSKVSLRHVGQKCRSEPPKVSLSDHKCCSEVSITSLA